MNVLDALDFFREFWGNVSHKTIENRFQKVGFSGAQLTSHEHEHNKQLIMTLMLLLQKKPHGPTLQQVKITTIILHVTQNCLLRQLKKIKFG